MNRNKLLKALESAGFDATEATLEKVKRWLSENNVELHHDGKPVDIDAAWEAKTEIVVDADPVADDSIEKRLARVEALHRKAAYAAAQRGSVDSVTASVTNDNASETMHWTPEATRRKSERDRYNRRFKETGRDPNRKLCFDDADTAERFGAFVKMQLPSRMTAYDREVAADIEKTFLTTDPDGGAPITPGEFNTTLIDLKEIRGVTRQILGTTPMSRDEFTVPRRTGGLTVFSPGEGNAIQESEPTFDNVTLVAKKLATLTKISSESMNDSLIDIGNLVAREIAYAFADAEDLIFQQGDGTSGSPSFGFTGVQNKFRHVLETAGGTWSTDNENLAGLIVGSGNTYAELTIEDFMAVLGVSPAYVDQNGPFWVMHKRFHHEVIGRLAHAAGGKTMAEFRDSMMAATPMAFGYPVKYMQTAPRMEANDQVCVTFGAFNLGAMFGEVRNSMTIALSDQRYFDEDNIAIRGIERIALTIHDVGNYHVNEDLRVPGPIVGLVTAGS